MCPCSESIPNCSITVKQAETFPGQQIFIEAAAIGQRYGTVAATVVAQLQNNNDIMSELDDIEYVQSVGTRCTNLTFTLHSSAQTQNILLTSNCDNRDTKSSSLFSTVWLDLHGYDNIFHQLVLEVHLKKCPLGFYFNTSSKQCSCLTVLTDNKIICDLSANKVLKPMPKWINATFIPNSSRKVAVVVVHNHCPFDYCIVSDESIALDLEYPDEQCAFNRSGILCGACKQDFSNVLGTSKCKECPKPWIFLIDTRMYH